MNRVIECHWEYESQRLWANLQAPITGVDTSDEGGPYTPCYLACLKFVGDSEVPEKQQDEVGALMAAAPKMRKALQSLKEHLDAGGGYECDITTMDKIIEAALEGVP